MCTTCGLFDCDGCRGEEKRRKTMETDVYAFGCLYYAVRMDFHFRNGPLIQDLYRHSLIPLLFMTRATIKLFDLSCRESARID